MHDDNDDNREHDDNEPCCPLCDGTGVALGQLGRVTWYRCRACGIDFRGGDHA